MTTFITGIVVGILLAYNYEEELDDFSHDVKRCCKRTKKKMRELRDYMD